MKILGIGLDLGSTTAKFAVVDSEGKILESDYRRHGAAVKETALTLLKELQVKYPDTAFELMLTGSAALDLAVSAGAGFIQEVIASSRAIKLVAPDTDVAIELGGEDAKILYLSDGMELRMNEVCAGGTGAFIDQMASLLNTDASGLNKLAADAKTIYPVASRCGVFAKTDVVPLLNAGSRREDVAASILQAVVDQTIGGLACGRPIRGKVAFLGGPLHFLDQLRARFIATLKLTDETIADIPDGQFIVAYGAALCSLSPRLENENRAGPILLSDWIERIERSRPTGKRTSSLPPLFTSEEEYQKFLADHSRKVTPRAPIAEAKGDLWMGVDLGSTTMKAVVLDSESRIVKSWYGSNTGSVLPTLLPHVIELLKEMPEGAQIRGICTTGYGADLAASVLGTPLSEVETVAHLRAATFLDPKTTYVIDIGGQDMKCLKTHNGVIEQVKLNEACSSGCGAFIQTFAKSLNLTLPEFVHKALFAKNPADLGTRCTVFMNSRVKQAQKEGADVGDIAAGLCYSVIRNALYKVLRLRSAEELGDHVVVQGGSFLNDALLRVLEKHLGKPVLRPDIAGLMGAYGCALIAREKVQMRNLPAPKLDVASLEALEVVTRSFRCKGCNNRCMLTMNRFSNGRKFISGNRCDFGARGGAKKKEEPTNNVCAWKLQHLFEGEPLAEENAPQGVIGIPRALNIYEHYPFWFTLFTKLGFRVVLSPESTKSIFDSGLSSMPSQSVCFPAKLAHGHVTWLATHGVKRIWFPCIPKEEKVFKESDNTFACPVVAGYPEVVRLNADLPAGVEPQVLTPFVLVSDKKVVKRVMLKYFPQLDGAAVDRAYDAARDALADWKQRLEAEGEKVLSEAQAAGKTVVLIAGRPYHVDPLINHGLPDYIASLGVSVVTEDSVMQLAPEPGKLRVVNQWAYHSRLYRAAALAATEPCVELIHLTNFGCGIDAITSDQVAEILQRSGKLYTLLKIDEGDSLGPAKIRIASLLATVEERKAGRGMPKADESDETPAKAPAKPAVFVRSMRETHTILAPQMSAIHFAILEKALSASGYKLKLLPVASPRAIETGLKYVNNDACYPAIVTIGQLVNALKENVEDPDHTALMLAQTCGPCRATNYIALLHRALAEAGFSQVPVVSLSGGSLNEQPGFSISPLALRRAMIATLYGDMLQRLYYATKAHELFKGDAKEKLDEWIERARDVSFRNSVEDFESDMIPMVREFGSIPQDDIEKPRVGIVGEILLKYHPDANRHLTDMILAEGGEPVLTDMTDFFLYCLDDSVIEQKFRRGSFLKSMVGKFFMGRIESLRRSMREALAGTRYMPIADFKELQTSVKGIVSLGEQAGEGWLLTAEMIDFINQGVPNVLCLQPFGCLPNHITGKGVAKAIRGRYPESNLMALDFEAGSSEANIANRVKLFMTIARETKQKEIGSDSSTNPVVENAKKVLDRLRGIGGVEERPVRVYGFNRESSK